MRRLFTIVIGMSALFIAACSAFCSVRGLGLLFVGSATVVMVMAASLEVGKLVAASFLYQYWSRISLPVRLYLMLAVCVLIGITSLGIYGYLAAAYERTNLQVNGFQQQIDLLERDVAETQQRIDASNGLIGRGTDAQRADIDKAQAQLVQSNQALEQAMAALNGRRQAAVAKRDAALATLRQQTPQANQALEQALTRLEDRRKAARSKRDKDIEPLNTRSADADKLLATGLASEDAAIAALNDRVAVLDRAVDAYTKEGGPGVFKEDSIKKGQVLREQQQPQRDAIEAEIAKHRLAQDGLRKAHDQTTREIDAQIAAAGAQGDKELTAIGEEEKGLRAGNSEALKGIDKQVAAAGEQYTHDAAALDEQEKALRSANAGEVAAARGQIAMLQAKGVSLAADGGNQIESLHQRIATSRAEIGRLNSEIANTEVGSYRFVARAFNAPVDEVVKWLMLVMVLVFDPLAVVLTIGFNVALKAEWQRRRELAGGGAGAGAGGADGAAGSGAGARAWPGGGALAPAAPAGATVAAPGRWRVAMGAGVAVVLATALLGGGVFIVVHVMHERAQTSHAALVPDDAFAVVAFRPDLLRQSPAPAAAAAATGAVTGGKGTPAAAARTASPVAGLLSPGVAAALSDLLQSGFDPDADVYAFVKYPSDRAEKPSDRPVMLLGMVARVTDAAAAEAGLSRCADALDRSLRPPAPGSAPLARNRMMVRWGQGRYLDPEGGFLSFGITGHAAVLMLEIEGTPGQPRVEQEMRLCLEQAEAGRVSSATQAPAERRILPSGDAMAIWLDAGRCFANMPKSPAAQVRYQQLQRYLDFNLRLVVQTEANGQLDFKGQYIYAGDRFHEGTAPPPLELLAKLGPAETAGIRGRLMDRCADTLDFDSLIDRLRLALANSPTNGVRADVVVEKTSSSVRDGQFVLTAHYDPKAGPPLVAALRSLSLF